MQFPIFLFFQRSILVCSPRLIRIYKNIDLHSDLLIFFFSIRLYLQRKRLTSLYFHSKLTQADVENSVYRVSGIWRRVRYMATKIDHVTFEFSRMWLLEINYFSFGNVKEGCKFVIEHKFLHTFQCSF